MLAVASDIDIQPQQRLHPLSWLFALVASVRQFLVPLVAIVFFGARNDGSLQGALLIVPLLIAAMWRQMSFRYGFGADSLVIREGWLFRNVRRIEYRRIENIDTERGVLHRLLGVAEVRLESSTGGRPEGSMRVLGLDAVQELRERIFDQRSRSTTAAAVEEHESSQVLLQLSPGELLRYGLIDNRGLLIIAAFFGLIYQANLVDFSRDTFEPMLRRNWPVLSASILDYSALWLVVFGVPLFLAVTRLLSMGWAVVTLYDFKLTRQSTDLRVSYGLLTRVALTLRLPRIQAVQQTQSLLHRLFDRVRLSVDLAGDSYSPEQQQGDENKKRVRWLAPLCTPAQAAEIIHVALPMLDRQTVPDWRPLAPGARARIFRKTAVVMIVVASTPSFALMRYGAPLLLPLVVLVAWWYAVTYTNHTRWALTRDALLLRSGWLTRRLSIVPRNRIQVVDIDVSPFDRRHRMATLIVDTAGASSMSGPLQIPYLEFETASRLAQALYRFEGAEVEPVTSPSAAH